MKTTVIYEPAGRAREYAPLAANLYAGCGHGCQYCYAPAALRRDKAVFHGDAKPRDGIMPRFAKDCESLNSTGAGPILLSFTTDPYQMIDQQFRLTRQAIGLMHSNGLAVEILTKGGMRAARDFDLLGPADAFATTLTFVDPVQSVEWEPFAALPADRMAAMRFAHSKDIRTWASLEPVIDPAQSLELIRLTADYVDLFKLGVWNHDARAKAIDWAAYGRKAIALLESLGKDFYVKLDLRQRMA